MLGYVAPQWNHLRRVTKVDGPLWRKNTIMGITALVCLLGGPRIGFADVIPDAFLDQRVLIGSNGTPDIEYHGLFANSPSDGVITYTGPSNVNMAGTMTVTAVISPSPMVTVSSNVPGEGSSVLTYYGEIVGPANVSIPIDLTGAISVNIDNGAGVFNDIVIETNHNGGITFFTSVLNSSTLCNDSLSLETYFSGNLNNSCQFQLSDTVTSNSVFTVELFDQASIGAGSDVVSIDPVIGIDPSFGSSANYSIELSNGVGNFAPTSVPEPSSGLIVLVGLLGLLIVLVNVERRNAVSR